MKEMRQIGDLSLCQCDRFCIWMIFCQKRPDGVSIAIMQDYQRSHQIRSLRTAAPHGRRCTGQYKEPFRALPRLRPQPAYHWGRLDRSGSGPLSLGFCHGARAFFGRRQVLSEVVNHLCELFVSAFGASADHVRDDAVPLFTSHPPPGNNLRRMARRAYPLNRFSIRRFRELRTWRLARSAPWFETGKQKDGEPCECHLVFIRY